VRRLALVVALAVLLSGCNALGSAATDRQTVTPAPVPDASTRTTTGGTTCLGPPLAAVESGSSETPTTPVPLRSGNGTVDGRTLVERHVAALSNHSYHLRTDLHRLWVMRGGVAFTYESAGYDWTTVRAYAVDGRLYTFVRTEYDTLEVTERRYRPRRLAGDDTLPTLTARRWLANNVAPLEYTVADGRTRNGTRVRVLRAAIDNGSRAGVTNATLFVDRRGIVRRALVDRIPLGARTENRTERLTYAVDGIGTARPFRPEAFCRADWSATGE